MTGPESQSGGFPAPILSTQRVPSRFRTFEPYSALLSLIKALIDFICAFNPGTVAWEDDIPILEGDVGLMLKFYGLGFRVYRRTEESKPTCPWPRSAIDSVADQSSFSPMAPNCHYMKEIPHVFL